MTQIHNNHHQQRHFSPEHKKRQGNSWIWLNAGAIALCIILVTGLIGLIAVRGLAHFWPSDVLLGTYQAANMWAKQSTDTLNKTNSSAKNSAPVLLAGEPINKKTSPANQLQSAGYVLDTEQTTYERLLLKTGNRDLYGIDFIWILQDWLTDITYPENLVVIERMAWGNFYGFIRNMSIRTPANQEQPAGKFAHKSAWENLQQRIRQVEDTRKAIQKIEKRDIGTVNYQLEQLRLAEKRARAANKAGRQDQITAEQEFYWQQQTVSLEKEYQQLTTQLKQLRDQINQDYITVTSADGIEKNIFLKNIQRIYQPNAMSLWQKLALYFTRIGEFITEDPREANTEGGIFPAIFGTVLMVILMAILVTPLGVIAAIYLHEYTKENMISRFVRIAVNNLAGVPSVVYGIFGLGFFVYFIGGRVDAIFYAEALPSPTFGTPGLLWASLTLAILTIPVVIVSTEEGLSRIPKSIREGGLALGATKTEVLWRLIIPMASPGIMTGVILAIARAAGEVAPLMLVGAVKLAPNLAFDSQPPYLHLDRKFMHLGFHIYDVGFQSPNVEASRPLVYATAFLLILIIVALNLLAIMIRNHLREKYKTLES